MLQLVMQYVVNLTMGLISAMIIFLWRVGSLCFAYGESFFSGLAFFGLVATATVSVVSGYLGLLGGGVAVGVRHIARTEAKP